MVYRAAFAALLLMSLAGTGFGSVPGFPGNPRLNWNPWFSWRTWRLNWERFPQPMPVLEPVREVEPVPEVEPSAVPEVEPSAVPEAEPSAVVPLEDTSSPILCEGCIYVVGQLQALLGNDSKQIIAELDAVCDELPAQFAATCKQYVNGYVPMILDLLTSMTPKELCEDLTLCAGPGFKRPLEGGLRGHIANVKRIIKTKVHRMAVRTSLGNQFLCDGCTEVVNLLRTELTDPMIWDELEMLLSLSCDFCPQPDRQDCLDFFRNLTGKVVDFIDKYLNDQTCKTLGLCTAEMTPMVDPVEDGMDGAEDEPDSRRPLPPFVRDFLQFGREWWDTHTPRHPWEAHPRRHPWERHFPRRQRPHQHDHDSERPQRPDLAERPQRPEYPQRPQRPERPERPQRPERPERPQRPEYPQRPQRPDYPQRPQRPDRPGAGLVPEDHEPGWGRPWLRPEMKPHRPRPPYKPEAPEVEPEMPEVVPEMPEVDPEMPEVVIPEMPDEETLGLQPEARILDPEDPYGLKRLNWEMKQRLQEMGKGGMKGPNPNKPSPWMDLQTRLNRKQRSIQISTVVNAEDFDPLNTFDVEELEDNWQCDMCEYVTGVLRSYLEKNKDTIEGEISTLGNKFCDRLPFTTVNECKAEVADVVPTFVSTLLDQLTSSNLCGAALQIC